MQYAVIADDPKSEADPRFREAAAVCESCGAQVRPYCGPLVCWHWKHVSGTDCDTWSEGETEWHRGWKARFSKDCQEVVVTASAADGKLVKHRADVKTERGVLELQHSPIATAMIGDREVFYRQMVWLFDLTECDRIELRSNGTLIWSRARRSILQCQRPVFLHLPNNTLVNLFDYGTHQAPFGDFQSTFGYYEKWTIPEFVAYLTGEAGDRLPKDARTPQFATRVWPGSEKPYRLVRVNRVVDQPRVIHHTPAPTTTPSYGGTGELCLECLRENRAAIRGGPTCPHSGRPVALPAVHSTLQPGSLPEPDRAPVRIASAIVELDVYRITLRTLPGALKASAQAVEEYRPGGDSCYVFVFASEPPSSELTEDNATVVFEVRPDGSSDRVLKRADILRSPSKRYAFLYPTSSGIRLNIVGANAPAVLLPTAGDPEGGTSHV